MYCLFFCDCFFSCGVMGRVLELIPVAFQQRQSTPTDESPAHHRTLSEHWGGLVTCSRVPQQCSEGVLAHLLLSPHLLCPTLRLEPKNPLLSPLLLKALLLSVGHLIVMGSYAMNYGRIRIRRIRLFFFLKP